MPCSRTRDVLVFVLTLIAASYGQHVPCTEYETCDECIGGFDCVWCPDPPPFSGPRCTSSDQNVTCLSPLEDPVAQPPEILKNDSLGVNVQVSPQEILLHLRTGQPQTFTLSVKPSRNYPLDLYFLMDLSGSQSSDLMMLRNLSTSITDELASISSQYTLGYGSFVDKIAYPYASILQNGNDYRENHLENKRIQCANGRDSCEPTYVFRHHLELTNNNSEFTGVLNGVTIRANLDASEATLEALLQSVVCPDIVGWRDDSLKIIMVLTDAGFKTALDGKVATLLTPNDGECHLVSGEENGTSFYEYIKDPEQDFPSIYQVRQKLIENDVITIFTVAKSVDSPSELYELLAAEFGSTRSFVQSIRNDSSDIVEVIRQAYESVTQDVVVDTISGLDISLTPAQNCNPTPDGMGCAGVMVEDTVMFNITVTMDNCLSKSRNESLALPGFGSVLLRIEPICECNCSLYEISQDPACNEKGDLVCGTCNCYEGSYGDQCECDKRLMPCPDHCFNRGTCDNCTTQCISCDTEEVEVMDVVQILGSYGARCQCDNSTIDDACPSSSGAICSGRGDCQCVEERCSCTCDCHNAPKSQLPYFGPDCSCDPDNCHNDLYPNRQCAQSRDPDDDGTCTCDGCMCPTNSVPFENTCTHNDEICTMYKDCAEQWFKASNTTEDGCTPNSLDDITGAGVTVICQYDQNNCIVDYHVQLNGGTASVYVGEERSCKSDDIGQLAWIIAVSIVGGILLLGIIVLIVAKIILMTIDRKEYKKFLDDMHTGDFVPVNNPLYVTPETEYKNPILNKKLPGDEDAD